MNFIEYQPFSSKSFANPKQSLNKEEHSYSDSKFSYSPQKVKNYGVSYKYLNTKLSESPIHRNTHSEYISHKTYDTVINKSVTDEGQDEDGEKTYTRPSTSHSPKKITRSLFIPKEVSSSPSVMSSPSTAEHSHTSYDYIYSHAENKRHFYPDSEISSKEVEEFADDTKSVASEESMRSVITRPKFPHIDITVCGDVYSADTRAGPFFEDSFEDYDAMKLEEFMEHLALDSGSSKANIYTNAQSIIPLKSLPTNSGDSANELDSKTERRFKFGRGFHKDKSKKSKPVLKKKASCISYDQDSSHNPFAKSNFSKTYSESNFGDQTETSAKRLQKEIHTTLAMEAVLSKVKAQSDDIPDHPLSNAADKSIIFCNFDQSNVADVSYYNSVSDDEGDDEYESDNGGADNLSNVSGVTGYYSALGLGSGSLPEHSSASAIYFLDYISTPMEKAAIQAGFNSTFYATSDEEIKRRKQEYQYRNAALHGRFGTKLSANATGSISASAMTGDINETLIADENDEMEVANYYMMYDNGKKNKNSNTVRRGFFTNRNNTVKIKKNTSKTSMKNNTLGIKFRNSEDLDYSDNVNFFPCEESNDEDTRSTKSNVKSSFSKSDDSLSQSDKPQKSRNIFKRLFKRAHNNESSEA